MMCYKQSRLTTTEENKLTKLPEVLKVIALTNKGLDNTHAPYIKVALQIIQKHKE